MRLFPKRTSTTRLRDVINYSHAGEVLHSIPDRLAAIIERYDATQSDPHFRHDIYNILSGSIDIAEAMVDDTFSIETATEQLSRQLEVLSRVLHYFNHRPSRVGYSILIPATHQLIGQYGTEQEAEAQLASFAALAPNSARNAMVVPVKVISQHAVQPKQAPAPAETNDPIPAGVQPTQFTDTPSPLPLTAIEDRVTKAEEEAATLATSQEQPR